MTQTLEYCTMNRSVMLFVLLIAMIFAVGCATDQPGVKNRLGAYETMVAANPAAATSAAKKAMEQMKLINIESTSTELDGKVTGQNAGGDEVVVAIAIAGDGVSRISVRVGWTGDSATSQAVLKRIRALLK